MLAQEPVTREYSVRALEQAYLARNMKAAYEIANMLLTMPTSYRDAEEASFIQYVMGVAATSLGRYYEAIVKLEQAAETSKPVHPHAVDKAHVITLAQYAVTLLEFSLNNPEGFEKLKEHPDFDPVLAVMGRLLGVVLGAFNMRFLAIYEQTNALLVRLRAEHARRA